MSRGFPASDHWLLITGRCFWTPVSIAFAALASRNRGRRRSASPGAAGPGILWSAASGGLTSRAVAVRLL